MELGVPQTEVANKSQTTFNYSNCTAFDFTKNTLVKKQNTLKNIPAITSDFKFEFVIASSFNNYTQPHVSRNHSVSRVPLYILYQNFKDYL